MARKGARIEKVIRPRSLVGKEHEITFSDGGPSVVLYNPICQSEFVQNIQFERAVENYKLWRIIGEL
ncbi:MAG: hypothetical protein V2A74_06635, partial [bacterium]